MIPVDFPGGIDILPGTQTEPVAPGAFRLVTDGGTPAITTDGITFTNLATEAEPGAIPLTDLASQADQTMVGNVSGGAASPVALTQAQVKTFVGSTSAGVAGLVPSAGLPLGTLPASLFKSFCSLGADASGGATHITATGVKVGDKVVMVADVTDHISAAADFEATVTVADQIQQSAVNLSAKTLVIFVIAQS